MPIFSKKCSADGTQVSQHIYIQEVDLKNENIFTTKKSGNLFIKLAVERFIFTKD